MKHFAALLVLLGLVSAPALAETRSGFLVDGKCYASEVNNVGPYDLPFNVNHGRGFEIEACRPSKKTKIYAIVNADGYTFELDSAANPKAAEIVRGAGKKRVLSVKITGEEENKTLKVDTITLEN